MQEDIFGNEIDPRDYENSEKDFWNFIDHINLNDFEEEKEREENDSK